MLGFSQFCEQPVDFRGFEGHIDLDGGVAGDGSGDPGASGFFVFNLRGLFGSAEKLVEDELQLAAFEAYGGGFYGERAGAEGLGFEAVAFELFGDGGEGDHLGGKELNEDRHEEALALDFFYASLAKDLFKKDTLVGYVLVDDPETLFVGGEDEGVAELAEGFEGGQGVEGGLGFVGDFVVADGLSGTFEGEAAGGFGDDGGAEIERSGVGGVDEGFRLGDEGVGLVERLIEARERAYVDHERGTGVGGGGERGEEAGGGTGVHERGANGVADEVVDEAALAEANLCLGGVDVDVDLLRGHLEEEQDDREGCWRDDVAIGFGEGVEDETVADEAAVDEDVDGVAVELLQLGLGDEAAEANEAGFGLFVVGGTLPGGWLGDTGVGEVELGGNGDEALKGFAAEYLEEALAGVEDRRCDEESLRGRVQLEVFLRVREGVVRDERGDVAELGGLATEEFAAGGGVEEEVADGDGGAGRQAGIFDAEDIAAGDLEAGADFVVGGAGVERKAGDGGDGGQGFSAEAERGDGEEVVGGAELGGSVALEGEERVVAAHTVAVVYDADELAAAGFDFDADARGVCVEGVFEEFLDYGGGTLNHLARGDLVGYLVGENVDAAHRRD